MKKAAFFLLLPSLLPAQQWVPLTVNEKFNFRHADSTAITHTIWVDSVKTEGVDSLFYLNRIVVNCPDCLPDAFGYKARLRNRGQFLQKTMRKTPSGNFVFEGEHTFLLIAGAETGATWLFDPAQNTTATVVSKLTENVFGITDSVKTIALSNGFSFRLSKSFGLLSFPETIAGASLELVGIEGRNTGEKLPDYRAFFDFQPGDVFQYKDDYHFGYLIGHQEIKYSILTREDTGDGLLYHARRNMQTSESFMGNNYPVVVKNDTVAWNFTPDSVFWLNYYPGQLIPINWLTTGNFSTLRVFEDPVFGLAKRIGERPWTPGEDNFPDIFEPYPAPASDTMLRWFTNRGYVHSFAAGIGETYFFFNQPSMQERRLIGYVKNGDTTGTVLTDFTTSGAVPADDPGEIRVLGNPCRDFCHLQWTNQLNAPAVLEVYNERGQLVLNRVLSGQIQETMFPVTDFQEGVYVLHMRYKGGFIKKKVIFKR